MRNLVILRLCGYNKTVSDSVWKGCVAMYQQIAEYFQTSSERWFSMLAGHIGLSAGALLPAIVIAVPAGFLCVRYARLNRPVTALFGTLRIIPSLAVLLLMLPVLGTGALPAMAAQRDVAYASGQTRRFWQTQSQDLTVCLILCWKPR